MRRPTVFQAAASEVVENPAAQMSRADRLLLILSEAERLQHLEVVTETGLRLQSVKQLL